MIVVAPVVSDDDLCSQFVMFWSRELFVRDHAVLVFVFMSKDLLHQLVLVLHHLLGLLPLLAPGLGHGLHLLLQVAADLVPAQLFVAVKINLLEHVHWSWTLVSTDQLNIKEESCSSWNNVSCSCNIININNVNYN